VSERACTLMELRGADLLSASAGHAWLRLWTEVLVLAFLTNKNLPVPPARLRHQWAGLDPRLRECTLATLIDRSVGSRAASMRGSYDPDRLIGSVLSAALPLLAGVAPAGRRAGAAWVVPQLRWLHEVERISPFRGPRADAFDRAPPLDYDLVGAMDWPDMRVGHRIYELRRHPLSMELEPNRRIALNLLLGDENGGGFAADVKAVMVGQYPDSHYGQVAAEMQASGWLEVVLSWPYRFVAADADELPGLEAAELAP
jgi:hypothetical protein